VYGHEQDGLDTSTERRRIAFLGFSYIFAFLFPSIHVRHGCVVVIWVTPLLKKKSRLGHNGIRVESPRNRDTPLVTRVLITRNVWPAMTAETEYDADRRAKGAATPRPAAGKSSCDGRLRLWVARRNRSVVPSGDEHTQLESRGAPDGDSNGRDNCGQACKRRGTSRAILLDCLRLRRSTKQKSPYEDPQKR